MPRAQLSQIRGNEGNKSSWLKHYDDNDDEEDEHKVETAEDAGSTREGWEKLWGEYQAIHAKNNIRSSFYQTDTTLNVDFFVKNVPKDSFNVDAQSQSVSRIIANPLLLTRLGNAKKYV